MNVTPRTRRGADGRGEPTALAWQRQLGLGTTALAFAALTPLVVALGLAKPWIVGMAAVPLLVLVAEAAVASPPRMTLRTSVDARQVTEGTTVVVSVEITSSESGVVWLRPHRSGSLSGADDSIGVDLARNLSATTTFDSTTVRWGRGSVGLTRIEWRTPLGLISWRARVDILETVWVYPRPIRIRSRLGVSATTLRTGPHRSRARGGGSEFHSMRPFEVGDRWRDLDHRTLARTGEPWTRTRHADRSRDLVVVVDLLEDNSDLAGDLSVANQALRAADAVVQRHLDERDRVGLLILGSRILSVPVRDGRRQRYVIIDHMMRATPRQPPGLVGTGVDLRKRVPAGATVLIVSPLLDPDLVSQIHALRRHGRDVAVLQVGYDIVERMRPEFNRREQRAADLHRLKASATRARLSADRIPVQTWSLDQTPDTAVERIHLLHQAVLRRRR